MLPLPLCPRGLGALMLWAPLGKAAAVCTRQEGTYNVSKLPCGAEIELPSVDPLYGFCLTSRPWGPPCLSFLTPLTVLPGSVS